MPIKSSAESVSKVEQPAGRVLNSIPTISRGKGKRRALSQSEEAVTNIIRDPGLAGPSTLKVKKGAFPTLHLYHSFTILVQSNAQRLVNALYALNTSQCGSSKRTANSRCSVRKRLSEL
jgi:hypothetical protein